MHLIQTLVVKMNLDSSTAESLKSNVVEACSDVILASLPFLIGFVSIPLTIFLPNLIEFDYKLAVIWP